MSGELKEDGAWVPLTPPKSAPARCEATTSSADKVLNHVDCGREFGVSAGTCSGGDQGDVRNSDGSVPEIRALDCAKIGEDCGAIASGKVGFVVDLNLGCAGGFQSPGLLGKPEAIIGGISENGLTKDSSVPMNQTSRKRSRKAMESNKKPQKRPKIKRHRPKVFDETKPLKPLTPKPRTPKRPKPVKKQIPKPVASPLKDLHIEEVSDYKRNGSCRQKLDFEVQNCVVSQNIPTVCDGIQIEPEAEPKQQSSSRFTSPIIVYRRVFRPNECLKNSRKTGPNCPKVFKKKRTMRKRAIVFDKYIGIVGGTVPPPRKRRRTAAGNEPLSLCHMAIHFKRKPRSLTQRRKSPNAWISVGKVSKKVGPTLNLTWKATLKKKRSNKSTSRLDLSSFVSDISKLQLSEAFLLKAFSIRTRDRDVDKFAAFVDIQDKVIQDLETKNSTEKEEILKDCVVVSCNKSSTQREEIPQDYGLSCNESIHRCLADEVMLEVETYPPVNGETSEVKCAKEAGLFSDIATPNFEGPCDEENVSENDNPSDEALAEALADFATERMECLNIEDRCNEIVVRDQNANGAIVPSEGKFNPLKKQRKQWPKVELDPEFMLVEKCEGEKDTEQQDEDVTAKYWREQKALFRGRVDSFIARMRLIQGDKRFSKWKGSVVDSVVGVYLTQNVSDHLSSSAFMALKARFPPAPETEHNDCEGACDCGHDIPQVIITEPPEPPSDKSEEVPITENCPSPPPTNQVPPPVKSDEFPMMENCPSPPPTSQVPHSDKSEKLSENCPSPDPSNWVEVDQENGIGTTPSSQTESTPGKKKGKAKEKPEINWDELRKQTLAGKSRKRTKDEADSVNWEAVRQAPVEELAKTILDRGMNNLLAARIKDFLDRIYKDHGSIDLEWLRDAPEDKAKDYLLSITGLGLKSVECVRLLSLHHHAFPVDTNVCRILVRLGWVPMRLPKDVLIHDLNQYPSLDDVQNYIWPRVCDYSQPDLYELHCQLIVCGKALCTKRQPNCNACPMRGDCRHFASAFASSRFRLDGSRAENVTNEYLTASSQESSKMNTSQPKISYLDGDFSTDGNQNNNTCNSEPFIEFPESPKASSSPTEFLERDIEDFGEPDESEIPTIKINSEEFIRNVRSIIGEDNETSKELVILRPEFASIPVPKLKDVKRLRTVHHVFELPDTHPLLSGFRKVEIDEPSPYLFAMWASDETLNYSQESRQDSNCEELITGESSQQNQNDTIVHGTIMIPCRTFNKGSFPLNGTYFQTIEVFADHKSSRNPIVVPRKLLWNLRRRLLYCGTSLTSICRDLSTEELQHMFWRGFICVRAVDTKYGRAMPLAKRFHHCKTRHIDDE
ncbi:hypothetical protein ABFS83_04G207400 [Erythranthe nasuta]